MSFKKDGFENVDYAEVAIDAAIGGVTSAKAGLSKGNSKHLMKQGKNTVKNYRGLGRTAKYYFSQTYTMFYKPLIEDFKKQFRNDIVWELADYYVNMLK